MCISVVTMCIDLIVAYLTSVQDVLGTHNYAVHTTTIDSVRTVYILSVRITQTCSWQDDSNLTSDE